MGVSGEGGGQRWGKAITDPPVYKRGVIEVSMNLAEIEER
jgi:hypothetical protein